MFALQDYALSSTLSLMPMSSDFATDIGERLAKISPWADIDYPAQALIKYLNTDGASVYKYAILYNNSLAGVMCIRSPWLKGPYLELLGLFPQFQGPKIGAQVMAWFEANSGFDDSGEAARNLWLLASDFNLEAIAFYERQGFVRATLLEDLTADGVHDVLMRKKLF